MSGSGCSVIAARHGPRQWQRQSWPLEQVDRWTGWRSAWQMFLDFPLTGVGFGAFRVSSQFLPRYTHPVVGYTLDSLPDYASIHASLEKVKQLREQWDIRLSFHPDQFVLLSSPSAEVTRKSIAELDYQAMLAEMIGADVLNIHAGGVYGDKQAALKRLREILESEGFSSDALLG